MDAPASRPLGTTIDLALIDGSHGWPTVFVDFCYVYAMLRKGGVVIVDDIQLHSVKELARLLTADTERFHLLKDLGKSLVFEKMKNERFLPDWNDLPYPRRALPGIRESICTVSF